MHTSIRQCVLFGKMFNYAFRSQQSTVGSRQIADCRLRTVFVFVWFWLCRLKY
ncbi:hypothetical protein KsCSTR_32880 [Candidatus Kuenenia stuttgartiensis]|uniref:Uncharacterized protein n=1 Tax=Kuenenia stuttgartiensis TaxID=174633 RepID=Q1Q4K8_KUEST|nr:hypothetical protein KsCSTR_32880 [Candidatus Kuenenia stuttgartiensis]CAJ74941.1 unknown protein [Candidatus Kuenenia stuttgartiensis]